MSTYYHRTTPEKALAILRDGFRDGIGTYMTDKEWSGVWVSDHPIDSAGQADEVVLKISTEADLAPYEWVEEGANYYREWLVPAELLNTQSTVTVCPAD